MFQRTAWHVVFVLIVVMKMAVHAQEYNQLQAQARVYEKVDNFMTVPVSDMKNFADYFHLGGFPNNLTAPDRGEATLYMYSLVNGLGSTRVKPVFYSLDDGVTLGYWQNTPVDLVPLLVYREPGMSGFTEDNEEMSKYWETCVNRETGAEERCVMQEGEAYIACVDNCTLIPCPDPVSQANCWMFAEEEQAECESNKKWCRNYEIKHVEEGDTIPRGYVPLTYSCMNDQGDLSQTSGRIRHETPEGVLTNGTCTFESGALVQRDLAGPFEYCAGKDPSGVCDNTFVGGYRSTMYDPRWRGWYISARNAQRPIFSDPYLFFNGGFTEGLDFIGLTYMYPLYLRDDQDRQVFHGVVAVDVSLVDIAIFLVDAFKESDYVVGIYEDREPHKMIGVSTGSRVVGQVRQGNNSNVCSDQEIHNGECMDAQLTINDLLYSESLEDTILRKAHLTFRDNGYDPEQVITLRENDEEVDSITYLATSLVYEQPGANLKWRIVVITPLENDSEDSITKDEGIFALICIIGILGFILCFILFILFYQRRNERAVQFADLRFTSAFILGCAFLNLSTLSLLGENTDELCLLRMWMFYLLSSICLSPLFVKVFRIWKLLGAAMSSAMQVKMNNFQAWLRTLPIPILQTVILIIFTFVDPPVATETIDWDSRPIVKAVTCQHETSAFYITQALFDLTLIVTGCILAYLTRNIDPRFGDAKALLFAMYNIAFTSLMLGVIFATVSISDSASRILRSIGVFWATVFSSAAFIVPRLMAAKSDRKKMQSEANMKRLTMKPRTARFSSLHDNSIHHRSSEESIKTLVCTANLGNAEPTLSSMKAWIPERGLCADVKTLDGESVEAEKFHLIAIGMQEATWGSKKKVEEESLDSSSRTLSESGDKEEDLDDGIVKPKYGYVHVKEETEGDVEIAKEDAYLAAVEGEDTVVLRKMIRSLLGDDYQAVAEEMRGQMRLYVWARKDVAPYIDEPQISGANTGIGNVLANKGGIVVSLNCMETRLTFLSAHLAAHEGENYYRSRCDNVYDILRGSKTFDLSQKFDVAISSHHMFVMGDLNFRTKFEGENEHEENFNRAMKMVKAEDWSSLYSYDELHKGIKDGHLLVDFQTLPCNFNPTFKVNRRDGFDYIVKRTPSYTDRILFKSSPNLHENLMPIAYEPCVDFITSDHKPVRGAFSIIPNDIIEPKTLTTRFRLVFSEIECSDLLAGDVDMSSDPYVLFVWDAIEMAVDGRNKFSVLGKKQKWATTGHKSKTLNPKWEDKKISLITTSYSIGTQAMLYLGVFDYDFMSEDDILGTLPLSIDNLVSMEDGQRSKELDFDRPLERYGKHGGRIKFKLTVSIVVG